MVNLESTSEFVAKVKATQHNAEINKRRRGNDSPGKMLANKQHSTNK
ncbi:DUF4023 family protein [Paenibacillus sp. Soil522]